MGVKTCSGNTSGYNASRDARKHEGPSNGFHGLDRLSRDSSDVNYLLISQYIILILTCAVISAQNETKPEVI